MSSCSAQKRGGVQGRLLPAGFTTMSLEDDNNPDFVLAYVPWQHEVPVKSPPASLRNVPPPPPDGPVPSASLRNVPPPPPEGRLPPQFHHQCMDGASPFGKAATWLAGAGQDCAGQTPPLASAAVGNSLRADAPAFIPPPTAPPPAPPGAKRPPPAGPYIIQQLEDDLVFQLQLRQIRLHQEYGRWVRKAFADLSCRGNRREILIRCIWAWRATAACAWNARDPVPRDPPRGASVGPQRQSPLGPSSSAYWNWYCNDGDNP